MSNLTLARYHRFLYSKTFINCYVKISSGVSIANCAFIACEFNISGSIGFEHCRFISCYSNSLSSLQFSGSVFLFNTVFRQAAFAASFNGVLSAFNSILGNSPSIPSAAVKKDFNKNNFPATLNK